MRLVIKRLFLEDNYTQGVLLIDDRQSGINTLEDVMREVPGEPVESWKVQDETAIPVGIYKLVLDYSSHFKKILPHLLDVPGFEYIRIHSGNTVSDSAGCPLVGYSVTGPGTIGASRIALADLMEELEAAVAGGEDITCEVVNAP